MRGIRLPGAVGEVGDLIVFVSDRGLLTWVEVGVFIVTCGVSVFATGWDEIVSLFS